MGFIILGIILTAWASYRPLLRVGEGDFVPLAVWIFWAGLCWFIVGLLNP